VDGPKRIRTWPDAFFRGKEDLTHRLDYMDHNADSMVLEGAPGDVLYWPSDAWHVGESVDDALSFAISVALFIDQHSTPALLRYAGALAERRLAPVDRSQPLDVRPANIAESPAAIDRLVQRATTALCAVSEDADLELRLRVAWLNHVTGFGFTRPPAPLERVPITDASVVRCHAAYPIIWLDAGDDFVCSANGHAFSVTASPRVVALLERVNGGDSLVVNDLIAGYAGTSTVNGVEVDTTPANIRGLLEKLASLRAIDAL
jgi:50S ribosomal protein L16 3-hydroxylase